MLHDLVLTCYYLAPELLLFGGISAVICLAVDFAFGWMYE